MSKKFEDERENVEVEDEEKVMRGMGEGDKSFEKFDRYRGREASWMIFYYYTSYTDEIFY